MRLKENLEAENRELVRQATTLQHQRDSYRAQRDEARATKAKLELELESTAQTPVATSPAATVPASMAASVELHSPPRAHSDIVSSTATPPSTPEAASARRGAGLRRLVGGLGKRRSKVRGR